jgi:hypothetical protein
MLFVNNKMDVHVVRSSVPTDVGGPVRGESVAQRPRDGAHAGADLPHLPRREELKQISDTTVDNYQCQISKSEMIGRNNQLYLLCL